MSAPSSSSRNRRTALLLGGLVAGMFAFGFALVPLYGLVCRVLDIPTSLDAGSRKAAPAVATDIPGRAVRVRFDTTLNRNLPWRVQALQPPLEVTTGTLGEARFRVHNDSPQPVTAQAIPSVVPWQATEHFRKLECFCFEQQTLDPGESRELVLRFIIAPQLPEGINALTVSYTFMNTAGNGATRPPTARGG